MRLGFDCLLEPLRDKEGRRIARLRRKVAVSKIGSEKDFGNVVLRVQDENLFRIKAD